MDCWKLASQNPLPAGAFLRSLSAPGWGHYYADHQDWNRGKIHMTAEILLITGVAASVVQERKLRMEYHTLASDRKSTRLNSSHVAISYAVFCLKKKN